MSVHCSVIVPTYRRPDLLDKCLRALTSQTLSSTDYEIIVADDAASATTHSQVTERAKATRVAVIYVPVTGPHGPAAARNAGSAMASGEILAFTDDDCLPEPTWLKNGLAAFAESSVDAAWGRLIMPVPTVPTDYERDASRLANAIFVTANCFCRRSIFEMVGGFDCRFTAAWREDSDLYFTLLERNCLIVHAREATVMHPVRPASWGASLRQQRKSEFDVLLARKHPFLYRERIPRFPKNYLAIAAFLVLAVIGEVTDSSVLTAVGILGWFAFTARFCMKRLAGNSMRPSHVLEMALTSAMIPPLALFWRCVGLWRFRSVALTTLWKTQAVTYAQIDSVAFHHSATSERSV